MDWENKKKKINGNVLLYPLNKVTKVKLNKEAKGLFRSRVRREWTWKVRNDIMERMTAWGERNEFFIFNI